MNINYSKLYSSWLDNVKDIYTRSSWGLEIRKCMEDNWRFNDAKRKWIGRIRRISLWSLKDTFDQERSSIQARIEIYNQ